MKKNIGNRESIEKKVLKAVRKELDKSNMLRNVTVDVRKNVIDVVRGDESKDPIDEELPMIPSSPTDMLNQLILDYFKWMNFKYSTEMFAVESGTKFKLKRKILRTKFKNSDGFSKKMPLLLELLTKAMNEPKKK
jgi:hypothetical protein